MERSELLEIINQTLANEPKLDDNIAAIAGTLSPEDLAAEIRAAYSAAEAAKEEPIIPWAPLGHPMNLGRVGLR